ncbi:Ras-like protein [Euroglyphus maynei]|uniref:Ras-like protein n=1 Tax=Euroglyphus maynei TaxID=6958 RepID=A0A1Y3AP89_EURMA|nr:Ras-like protein [Euroglyphus maynei]
MPPFVKVCVLGSTGVGKTKLIQQFVYNYYDDDQYEPTTAANSNDNIYHSSTMINGNLYHLKIVDMPAIKQFPTDATAEWSQYQQCHLRNANAYIFCFDLNSPLTFHYVKCNTASGKDPTIIKINNTTLPRTMSPSGTDQLVRRHSDANPSNRICQIS